MHRALYLTVFTIALVISLVVLWPSEEGDAGTFSFDRGDVVWVSVARNGETHRAERVGDEWHVGIASRDGVKWLGDAAAIEGLLFAAGNLTLAPIAGEGEFVAGPVLRVGLASGESRVLTLGTAALGGRVWAEIDGGVAGTLDSRVFDLVRAAGVDLWRDARAFAAHRDPTGLEIRVGEAVVEVERALGGWRAVRPVDAPGDGEQIENALRILRGMQGVGVAEAGAVGDGDPIATIRLHGGREGEWRITTLEIVGVSESDGSGLVARCWTGVRDAEESGEGRVLFAPVMMVLKRDHLDAISTDAMRYVARTSAAFPSGDVGEMTIRDPAGEDVVEVVRTLDGWVRGGEGDVIAESDALDGLSRLICDEEADGVELAGVATRRGVVEVTMRSLAGTVLGTWTLGPLSSSESDDAMLLVETRGVVRRYRSDVWAGVEALLPR